MTGIYLEWLKLKKLSHLHEQQCSYNKIYIERQKKLITSLVRRSLNVTSSKLIMQIWTLWQEHLKKQRFACVKKENAVKSQKLIFRKSQKLLTDLASSTEATCYSEHSIAIHSILLTGYVTTVAASVCGKLPAQEASSFCDFFFMTSCDFTAYNPVLLKQTFVSKYD